MTDSSVLRVSGAPWPLVHLVLFQATWFGIVYSAGQGEHGWAWASAAALLVPHLALARERGKELIRLLIAGGIGLGFDSVLVAVDALSFGASPILRPVPLWMVALWLNFAATLPVSIGWLRGRPVIAAAFGLIGGPLSYAAGVKLGALEWGAGATRGWIAVGIAWAVAAPLLLVVRELVYRPSSPSAR